MKKLFFCLCLTLLVAAGCNQTPKISPNSTDTKQNHATPLPEATDTTTPYGLFKNLTAWNKQNFSDWQLYDYANGDEHRQKLKSYGTGNITLLFKSYNNEACKSDCSAERTEHANLLNNLKKLLLDNGWKEEQWKKEPGFYNDYLYVKDGRPLVLLVGTRDAVKGGLYIGVEFFE